MAERDPDRPILRVADLAVSFDSADGPLQAIHDVSFELRAGQITGLVGESGSGKSVTGLSLMGLLPTSAEVTGSIQLAGRELVGLGDRELTTVRGGDIAMIFQDAQSALDPVQRIGAQIADTVRAHGDVGRRTALVRAEELLRQVGIPDPRARMRDFPHQLSGGMRQRVMIAVALAGEPSVLIADEPTTALDVTIQAQILDLLRDACAESGTALLMITHDLGVVAELCEQVITMYAGEVVETAAVDDLLVTPHHPYSSGLICSIPVATYGEDRLRSIPGRVPGLHEMPAGCRFEARCTHARGRCRDQHPELRLVAGAAPARSRCHFADELELAGATAPVAGDAG
ncbi:ABC transporter ATP-binding protein [Cumulibacter manganitolerans]|uniref:ABC transporter ATP-binding protein n=1 Tax=Cumulibacter manganitolerans TaxID=1884992 RepID=UPI001E535389|nr:ABC transporter ATP-binding protein [Cumulibacter manganitolerans]